MKKFLKSFLVYFLIILFLEIIYKTQVIGVYIDTGLVYMTIFTVLYSLILACISCILPKKLSFPVMCSIISLITIIFIGEALFTYIIGSTFSIYSLNLAGQAFDFVNVIIKTIGEKIIVMILFLIPLVLFIIFHNKFIFKEKMSIAWKYIVLTIIFYILALCSLYLDKSDIYSAYNLYSNTHAPSIMVNKFGLLTEFRLDIERFIFGFEEKTIIENNDVKEEEETEETIEYNKLDLTFDNIDENTKNYFLNKSASNKNDYTGIFKDKNLIYILAEGFNSIAVDPTITPTLYKLVNSSFIFTNYYSPVFMSTTGGEFQFATSLIPTQKNLNDWKTGKTNFLYSVGNVFNSLGYNVHAFHDWTYSYYKRHITMPTLGYSNYVGCRNGLEKKMNCKIWPPSDIAMIDATVDDYINEEHFAVYYITVSGHAEYNFYGNNMAAKNKSLVQGLPYSEAIRAYLATQIELDRAIEKLLQKLEENNRLDDTVIVLSGDHYPYTLNVNQINEISSYERDSIFEVNRSNLILYNSTINNTQIDKLASSVDVLPTILNMFGIEYDSRLLMGTDIMSDHDSLVIFNDYSWISEKGRYSTRSSKFTPNDGIEVEDNYVSNINIEVKNRINISNNIVSNNYYEKILSINN